MFDSNGSWYLKGFDCGYIIFLVADEKPISKPCTHCSPDNLCLRRAMAAAQIYYAIEKGNPLSLKNAAKLIEEQNIPPSLHLPTQNEGVFVGICTAESSAEQATCSGYSTRPRWHPPKD